MAAVSVRRSISAHSPTPTPTIRSKRNRRQGYAKFWGANMAHYGICENGELREENTPISI